MSELWKETHARVPGQNVSTITWIGYDAPQSIVPEAMKKHYAHDAAPDLNRFMAGLEHVQGGDGKSHTTLIGHSYGSTVLGAASNQGDLRTDDIIAVGSPGMLVEHAPRATPTTGETARRASRIRPRWSPDSTARCNVTDTQGAIGRRAASGARALALAATIALLWALTAGCSNMKELDYTPVRMDPDQARTKAKEVAGRLLEMTGVNGKVTEPGPSVSRCGEYGDDLFSTSHPWSVYGLTDDQVDTGMQNLRKALGDNGWKITKDGEARSADREPEIYAENKADQFAFHVTALKGGGQPDHAQLQGRLGVLPRGIGFRTRRRILTRALARSRLQTAADHRNQARPQP